MPKRPPPRTAEEARLRLEAGNRHFAGLSEKDHVAFDAEDLAVDTQGTAPLQAPFAAVVGCADARVPIGLLFEQVYNNLFVVRVAGNVLGEECLGSVEFASLYLAESLRLFVVLGHTHCGAVTATVDVFLGSQGELPTSNLRTLVDQILPGVRMAEQALARGHGAAVEGSPGYREALIDTAIAMHAAASARLLVEDLRALPGGRVDAVVWGVFDIASRLVSVHLEDGEQAGLFPAPESAADLERWADRIAASEHVKSLLEGGGEVS